MEVAVEKQAGHPAAAAAVVLGIVTDDISTQVDKVSRQQQLQKYQSLQRTGLCSWCL
jgi:hypothetical protein